MFTLPRASLFRRRGLVLVPILAALAIAAPVAARQPVVQELNPVPPDFYTCKASGGGTICRALTVTDYDAVGSGIWCGTGVNAFEVRDSGTDTTRATRYYDANGNLTRRERIHDFSGTRYTNPLTGATLPYQQHNTDWEVLAVPGDLSTATFNGHGVLSVTVPGRGVVLHESGIARLAPDGSVEFQAGPSQLSDYYAGDLSVVADLCTALGAG